MLSDGEIVTNQTKYRELSKEYAELEPVVQNYVAYQAVLADIQAATLLAKDLDRDMREMAAEELRQGEARVRVRPRETCGPAAVVGATGGPGVHARARSGSAASPSAR